ncbi:MAG: FitA-like ribbon-helix-helix domain-containing protein [Blastocatellia bacterium]
MTITVEIPDDLERRLDAEAREHGVSPSEYVRALLERALTTIGPLPFWMTASKEEWLNRFNEWMNRHDRYDRLGSDLPPLSDEAISRESIYGERG